MATATTGLLDTREVGIDEALALRDTARDQGGPDPRFTCTECAQPIRPHRAGGNRAAHFEHLTRNFDCMLSHRIRAADATTMHVAGLITTAELARRTAGGDDYIRTKDNEVKGLALTFESNPGAPEVVVVGKGPRIQNRAQLLAETPRGVPVYVKRATNAWEYLGQYRATAYRTDRKTIAEHRGACASADVAGILFLESTTTVSVNVHGGGFPDQKTRQEIEQAAIDHVTRALKVQGYTVEDRQQDNCGYDLLATCQDETLLYEVKGTDSPVPRFFISRNERRSSEKNKNWRLAVVTTARTTPKLHTLTPEEMEANFAFECLAWECTPKPGNT